MKITRTELRQIIREELNKELHKEGVLDTVKGFFGYGDKEKPTEELETFSIKDIKNKIGPESRPEKKEILFVFTSMLDGDEEAKELFTEYPSLFRDLSGLTLENKKLSGLEFKGVNFSGSKFNKVSIDDCAFVDCHFYSSEFNNCKLTNIRTERGVMDKAKMHNCKASNVSLRPSSASGAEFKGFNFNDWGFRLFDNNKICKQITFENCDFENHYLSGKFEASRFFDCNFGSTISGKYSKYSQFSLCDFKDIDFGDSVEFEDTTFGSCKFLNCNIDSSKVFGEGIRFGGVIATGTKFNSVVQNEGGPGSPIYLDSKSDSPCPANLDPRVKCVKNDDTVIIVDKNAV